MLSCVDTGFNKCPHLIGHRYISKRVRRQVAVSDRHLKMLRLPFSIFYIKHGILEIHGQVVMVLFPASRQPVKSV